MLPVAVAGGVGVGIAADADVAAVSSPVRGNARHARTRLAEAEPPEPCYESAANMKSKKHDWSSVETCEG